MDTQDSTLAQKYCARCQQTKPLFDFGADRARRLGVRAYCKQCHNASNQATRQKNLEKYKAIEKNWRQNNKEKMSQRTKLWAAQNPNRMTELMAIWRKANPQKAKLSYDKSNQKRRADPVFRMRQRIASGIRQCLKGAVKQSSVFDYLDYTAQDLKSHLERQFLPNMGWHNMEKWHIDHIVPISHFVYNGPHDIEFKRAWALSNLRPLWAVDNLRKSDKKYFLL